MINKPPDEVAFFICMNFDFSNYECRITPSNFDSRKTIYLSFTKQYKKQKTPRINTEFFDQQFKLLNLNLT